MKKCNFPMNQLSTVLKTIHSFVCSFIEQICLGQEYSLCSPEASSQVRKNLHRVCKVKCDEELQD